MSNEKSGLDKFDTRVCPICKKEIVLTADIAREGSYKYQRSTKHKPVYACSWKCYRLVKYNDIMKKSKLTADDVAWLRFARFPVPQERIPKWLREDCPI